MTSTPEPLPSLPPSPVEEQEQGQAPRRARRSEDVARAWHDDEPDAHTRTNAARKGKGKGRARRNGKRRAAGSGEDDDDDDDDEGEEENNAGSGALEGYPPTKEEEAESRRVQEVRHLLLA